MNLIEYGKTRFWTFSENLRRTPASIRDVNYFLSVMVVVLQSVS
jgi:hypothetical protein